MSVTYIHERLGSTHAISYNTILCYHLSLFVVVLQDKIGLGSTKNVFCNLPIITGMFSKKLQMYYMYFTS